MNELLTQGIVENGRCFDLINSSDLVRTLAEGADLLYKIIIPLRTRGLFLSVVWKMVDISVVY